MTGLESPLERALLDEVRALLDDLTARCAGDPARERAELRLLALEREQIVAVAYREEAVAGRVDALDVDDDVRALVRQTLVWIWKDEALHAEYLRGLLLRDGGLLPSAVAYGRQVQGVISGWVSATGHHRDPRSAPLRAGAATVLVATARVLGRIPPSLGDELRFHTFGRYCELNVALEATAELAYRRIVELAEDDAERETFARIREDEERHAAAFRILADALTAEGRLAPGWTGDRLRSTLGAVSRWFVPAAQREVETASRPRRFASGAPVVVRSGRRDEDRIPVLADALDAAGLGALARGVRTAAIRASFMLGYDRADRSNVNDPELVDGLAAYLRAHGVEDVAVLEAPTVYGQCFANRSVAAVAEYFGFVSERYRVVDIGDDLVPFEFERGFVQRTISGTWLDADLRIVMPKLRTDPTEFAHLALSSLEGTTGAVYETVYAGRHIDFRSTTMMLLDVAPPDFAIVDGWAPVADGPFGVMGCARPAEVRCVYAGPDALAVDEAVLRDLGIDDPRAAPIVRRAHHWFAPPARTAAVDGVRPPLGQALRGAHRSWPLRALGALGYPVYVYLSGNGERFVPAMDTAAFPPLGVPGRTTRTIRRAAQLAFGLHPPRRRARAA